MNVSELQARVERLEAEVRRWRWGLLMVSAVVAVNVLISPAHAAERFLTLFGLTADTITATDVQAGKIRATEVVTERVTIRDSSGKIHGSFGMASISDDVGLELRTPDGTRSATLKLDREDARLTLWAGVNKPSATVWASTGVLTPAGLILGGSGKTGANLELTGKEMEPSLTMSDAKGKQRVELGLERETPGLKLTDNEEHLRVRVSADDGAAYAGFYSQFGSIEFDKNLRTYNTPEPVLRIRGAQGGAAEVRFGMENAEPSAEVKDSSGNIVWSPKPLKVEPQPQKKPSKKDAANPL